MKVSRNDIQSIHYVPTPRDMIFIIGVAVPLIGIWFFWDIIGGFWSLVIVWLLAGFILSGGFKGWRKNGKEEK
jgi:hypothetical protein